MGQSRRDPFRLTVGRDVYGDPVYTVHTADGVYVGVVIRWVPHSQPAGWIGYPDHQALGVADCSTPSCSTHERAARALYRMWVQLGGPR
jgi:hypothetical protein